MIKDPLKCVKPAVIKELMATERKLRRLGKWGDWENPPLPHVQSDGWLSQVHKVHRNRVFSVLERLDFCGVTHLAVTSLSGERPTWWEMQRIKNELAGKDATAIEVYPPHDQVVDGADMFHIWVLRGNLPFGLHNENPMMAVLR